MLERCGLGSGVCEVFALLDFDFHGFFWTSLCKWLEEIGYSVDGGCACEGREERGFGVEVCGDNFGAAGAEGGCLFAVGVPCYGADCKISNEIFI